MSRVSELQIQAQPALVPGVVAQEVVELTAWRSACGAFALAADANEPIPRGVPTRLSESAVELALVVLRHGSVGAATACLESALVALTDDSTDPADLVELGGAIHEVAEELIALYARCGDRSAAERALERCRVALRRLGTDA